MSKEAGTIDNAPILGVPQTSGQVITEGFSRDDETPEILADLSDIFDKISPEGTPNNQPAEAQNNNPFALNSLPHMRFTEERQNRLNSQSANQSWKKYSGLGFKTIGQSYSSHQNSSSQ